MLRSLRFLIPLVALLSIPLSAAFFSFEQITVANASIGFTAAKITPAGQPPMTVADCRVRTAELSFTYDGTTPTSTVGVLLEVGDRIVMTGREEIVQFRAIRTTSTSGQLDCTYKVAN